MAATNSPLGQVQAFRMRLCKLDSNGVPTPGAGKLYVTSSLVLATFKPTYLDGANLRQENGEGVICVEFMGPDSFLGFDLDIQVCTPDPYLLEFLGGCDIITPASGFLGWSAPNVGQNDPTPISIELWSKRIDEGNLADDGYPYFRTIAPRVKKMRIGDMGFGNSIVTPSFSAICRENPHWYDGPLNDWDWSSDRSLHQIPVPAADVPVASTSTQTVSAS